MATLGEKVVEAMLEDCVLGILVVGFGFWCLVFGVWVVGVLEICCLCCCGVALGCLRCQVCMMRSKKGWMGWIEEGIYRGMEGYLVRRRW